MGILRITMGVESHTRRGDVRDLPDTVVDTGSEYTWVPRVVLEDLGIAVERLERFVTTDGMNLRVDLKTKRTIPAGPVPAAAAA